MEFSTPDCDMDDSTNIYVQELKNVFDMCRDSNLPEGYINQKGLVNLCSQLQLNEHCSYIIGQLTPFPSSLINFPEFKQKFVQILPEIVDFESSRESPQRKLSSKKSERHSLRPGPDLGIKESDGGELIYSENDTSNDILSDELLSNNEENVGSAKTLKLLPRTKTSTPQFSKTLDESRESGLDATLEQLGIAQDGYLGRYECRILCQHVRGLVQFSNKTLRDIFDAVDTDKDGRITVEEFRKGFLNESSAKYEKLGRIDSLPSILNGHHQEFVTFSTGKEKCLTFFTAIDPESDGFTSAEKLCSYWESLGISDGMKILSLCDLPCDCDINLTKLSNILENELHESHLGPPVQKAAILTYKAELAQLKSNLSETRGKAEHYWQELQNVNQRQSILIEELDQSQSHLEKSNEKKLREIETRYNAELRSYQEKSEKEKDRLIDQLQELESAIKVKATTETTLHKRIAQLEKDNSRLRKDSKDCNQTLEELQALNSELRQELEKSTGLAKKTLINSSFDASTVVNSSLWKHKADLLTAENKRLKDQVDELWENCNRNSNKMAIGTGVIKKPMKSKQFVRNSPMTASFRKAVQDKIKEKTKKRRENDSEEFESDPEPIFYRPRVRKYLKNRQRREKIEKRLSKTSENGLSLDRNLNLPSSSDEDATHGHKNLVIHNSKYTKKIDLEQSLNGPKFGVLRKQFSEERKQTEFQFKLEMESIEEQHRQEIHRLNEKFETEKKKLRDIYEKELKHLLEASKQQQEDFAKKIEHELNEKHVAEKRDMEIRWATEKNDLERHFAEDKMVMMAKLQDDFEVELRRSQKGIATSPPAMGRLQVSKIDSLQKEKKVLADSLEGQRNGYESRLTTQAKEFELQINALKEELADATDWLTPEDMPRRLKDRFYSLIDEWKDRQQDKLKAEKEDALSGLHNERENLASVLEEEKSVLVKQHAAQLVRLEERYTVELNSVKKDLAGYKIELEKWKKEFKEKRDGQVQVEEADLDGDSRDELLSLLEKNCSQLEAAAEVENKLRTESQELRREYEWLQNEHLALKGDFETLKSDKYPVKTDFECQTQEQTSVVEVENVELKARLDAVNLELRNSLNELSTVKADLVKTKAEFEGAKAEFGEKTADFEKEKAGFEAKTVEFEKTKAGFEAKTSEFEQKMEEFEQRKMQFGETKAEFEQTKMELGAIKMVEKAVSMTQTDLSSQDIDSKDEEYNAHLNDVHETLESVQTELMILKHKPDMVDTESNTEEIMPNPSISFQQEQEYVQRMEEPIQIMPYDPFLTADPFESGGLHTIEEEVETVDGMSQTDVTMEHMEIDAEERAQLKDRIHRVELEKMEVEQMWEEIRSKSTGCVETQTQDCDRTSVICQTDIVNLQQVMQGKDMEIEKLKTQLVEKESALCSAEDSILELRQAKLKAQICTVESSVQTESWEAQEQERKCEECETLQVKLRSFEKEAKRNNEMGCRRCLLLECRISELEQAMHLTSESGIEEMSGAEAYEDASHLRKENDRLKRKLEDAQEKVLDLKTCLAVVSSQQIRKSCSEKSLRSLLKAVPNIECANFDDFEKSGRFENSAKRRKILDFESNGIGQNGEMQATAVEQYLANQLEYMRQDNFLLNERLKEKEILLQEVLQEYKEQIRATADVGSVLMDYCKLGKHAQ